MKTTLKGLYFNIDGALESLLKVNTGSKKDLISYDTDLKNPKGSCSFNIEETTFEVGADELADFMKCFGDIAKMAFEAKKERSHMRFERDMRLDDLKRKELEIREKELTSKSNS